MLLATLWTAGWAGVGDTYKLVTNVSDLNDGDEFILVAKNGTSYVAAGEFISKNNKFNPVKNVIINNNVINWVDGFQVFTLESSSSNWYIKFVSGYLSGASGTDISIEPNKKNAKTLKITIGKDNAAKISFIGVTDRYISYSISNKAFKNYSTKSNPIIPQIYKKEVNSNLLDPGFKYAEASKTIDLNETCFFPTNVKFFTNPNNITSITYTSSNNEVATVTTDGDIELLKEGTTTITASFAGDATYKAGKASFELNVVDSRSADNGLGFSASSWVADKKDIDGNTHTYVTLANPNSLKVTYSSSNENVAMVDKKTGELMLCDEGTTIISANFAGNETYKPATVSYELTVKNTQISECVVTFTAGVDKSTNKLTKYGETISSTNANFNYGEYRLYANATTTISTTRGNILKIEMEGNDTDYPLDRLNSNDGKSTATQTTFIWEGNATEVKIKHSKQARVNTIKVTVELPKAKDFTYNEDDVNTIVPYDNANVTLNRTLYNDGWNTFIVPFDITAEQINAQFGEKTQVMAFDVKANDKMVNFTPAIAIEANKPYLIMPVNERTSYTFANVVVKEGKPEVLTTQGGIQFTGIYSPENIVEKYNSYTVAGINSKDQIVKLNNTGNAKAFRAFFILPAGTSASSCMLNIGGEATSIDKIHVEGGLNPEAPVYNLQGQRVNGKQLPSGIYVQNGRKFVVK